MNQENEITQDNNTMEEAVEKAVDEITRDNTTEEVTNVEEQQSEAPVEEQFEMDLSDLPGQEQVAEKEEPANQGLDQNAFIDNIVAKLAERLNISKNEAQEMVDDSSYVTKQDLKTIKEQAKQEALGELQKVYEAQRIVQEAEKQSNQVEVAYGEKIFKYLEKKNLKSEPLVKGAINLFNAMKRQKALELGRNTPVLTGEETKQLAYEHWKQFEEIYLKPLDAIPQIKQASQETLSAALDNNGKPAAQAQNQSKVQSFLEKKKAGNATLSDVIAALASMKN